MLKLALENRDVPKINILVSADVPVLKRENWSVLTTTIFTCPGRAGSVFRLDCRSVDAMQCSFISISSFITAWLGTNLIHDFTAVTFSVKLVFFREKCPFTCFREIPLNLWFLVNFNVFTFIYEGFHSFINSFCADFAVCYMSHFSTK